MPIDGDRTKHNATGAGSKPNQKAGRKMPTHLKNTKRPLDIHIAARGKAAPGRAGRSPWKADHSSRNRALTGREEKRGV